MAYLIDADVFIQAKNLHYGFDFCPAFWHWLIDNNTAGKVFSIDKIANELEAGDDDLTSWAQNEGNGLFLNTDSSVVPHLGDVSLWVSTQNYVPAAVSTFLQVADYYLVAHAKARGYTVVTHERAENSLRRIKIPNVCVGLGIQFMTPYEMLRVERARFVLGGAT